MGQVVKIQGLGKQKRKIAYYVFLALASLGYTFRHDRPFENTAFRFYTLSKSKE